MNSPSHPSGQYRETAPQLPGLSQDFRLDLGYSTSNPREQLEERRMHCSTPPVTTENKYSRVQSVHGVVEYQALESRTSSQASKPMRANSEREEDIGTQREAMNSLDWYEEKRKSYTPTSSPTQERTFVPRSSSLRAEGSPSSPVQVPFVSQGSTSPVRPPPRSSSHTSPSQERQLPSHERYSLVDSGPISAPVPRRVVSESDCQDRLSAGLTPPKQRRQKAGALTPPNSASKYATFEEMGIRGRAIAEVKAEKDENCVIM